MIYSKEELDEILLCRENPEYFIDNYVKIINAGGGGGLIDFKLFPFQKFYIANFLHARHNIIKKPRQMGLSYLNAALALWMASFFTYKNILVISIKDITAQRFLDKIKIAYRHLPDHLKIPIVNGNKNEIGTKSVIEFANGSRIQSVPSSKDAGRSEGVSLLICDEAAFIEHMEDIWAAAWPTLSTGGQCVLLSTTNGMGNLYHSTWVQAIEGRGHFNPVNLVWDMYPGRDLKWLREQREALGEMRFNQEVMCDFLKTGSGFFSPSMIKMMDDEIRNGSYELLNLDPLYNYFSHRYEQELKIWEMANKSYKAPTKLSDSLIKTEDLFVWEYPEKDGHYVIGADVAKDANADNDFQALQIVNWHTGELAAEYFGKLTVPQYTMLIMYLSEYYNNAFTAVEVNGVGNSVIELLLEWGFPEDQLYTQVMLDKKKNKYEEDYDTEKFGYTTTQANKVAMLQHLANQYELGTFIQKSQRSLTQHTTFIWHNSTRVAAMNGYSDDLIMASALTQECKKAYSPTHVIMV